MVAAKSCAKASASADLILDLALHLLTNDRCPLLQKLLPQHHNAPQPLVLYAAPCSHTHRMRTGRCKVSHESAKRMTLCGLCGAVLRRWRCAVAVCGVRCVGGAHLLKSTELFTAGVKLTLTRTLTLTHRC